MAVKEKKEMDFKIKGKFRQGGEVKAFSKTVKAFNENHAREKTYSILGSTHRALRRMIEIDEVAQANEEGQ
jgi:ribosomal protein L20A (L18A)